MILLTGASGFIGSHLRELLALKYGRENIILLTSKPIQGFQCLIHTNYNFDAIQFPQNINTIIHAGAFTPKNNNESNNIECCNSNIYNTAKLLNKITQVKVKFIFLSTLDVYDRDTIKLINEDSAIDPVSLYGYSKLYCEKIIEIWASQTNSMFQILRIGHIYGPGEDAYQKIIPVTIKKVLKNESPIIYGLGTDKRCFLYIKDCCEYIVKSIDLEKYETPINVVSDEVVTIKELTQKIINLSNSNVKYMVINQQFVGRNLEFNAKKLHDLLGKPSVKLEQGLSIEIDYMRQIINGQ